MSGLNEFLGATFAIDSATVVDALEMADVESWNSLTHMELIIGLEEKYGLELTQDDIVAMTSVGAIKDILARHGLGSE